MIPIFVCRLLRCLPAFLRCLPTCFAVVILCGTTMTTSAQMLVVLSEGYPAYEEVAQEMRERLTSVANGRLRIDVVQEQGLARFDDRALNAYKLVVTIGLSAAQVTAAREDAMPIAPLTLCLLIQRSSFEQLPPAPAGGREWRRSAVFSDQPVARQLDLIRIALPGKTHVGVIVQRSSPRLRRELLEGAQERGLSLHLGEVGAYDPPFAPRYSIYNALQSVIRESDVLLALPVTPMTNSGVAYDFLLTAYRAQIPVVGFSEGLVSAGALLSLHSTPRQQGRQGAEIAARILAGEAGLPAPQYPVYFTVRVNASVARSMGLRMQDESELAAALAIQDETSGEAQRIRSAGDPSARRDGQ